MGPITLLLPTTGICYCPPCSGPFFLASPSFFPLCGQIQFPRRHSPRPGFSGVFLPFYLLPPPTTKISLLYRQWTFLETLNQPPLDPLPFGPFLESGFLPPNRQPGNLPFFFFVIFPTNGRRAFFGPPRFSLDFELVSRIVLPHANIGTPSSQCNGSTSGLEHFRHRPSVPVQEFSHLLPDATFAPHQQRFK